MQTLLTGQSKDHIEELASPKSSVHRDMKASLLSLSKAATKAGFDLQVASSFRDFNSQLNIWNRKARGERKLLDDQGKPLVFEKLTPEQIVFAILRWSALPGASRHHWGTDIDVFDAKALTPGYQIQLTPDESDGMFGPFHAWLDKNLAHHDFFRPYAKDRGGVSPERWHISYRPLAERFLSQLTLDLLKSAITKADLHLKDVVLARLPDIYARFVTNIESIA